jgi:hypothetical protein
LVEFTSVRRLDMLAAFDVHFASRLHSTARTLPPPFSTPRKILAISRSVNLFGPRGDLLGINDSFFPRPCAAEFAGRSFLRRLLGFAGH